MSEVWEKLHSYICLYLQFERGNFFTARTVLAFPFTISRNLGSFSVSSTSDSPSWMWLFTGQTSRRTLRLSSSEEARSLSLSAPSMIGRSESAVTKRCAKIIKALVLLTFSGNDVGRALREVCSVGKHIHRIYCCIAIWALLLACPWE